MERAIPMRPTAAPQKTRTVQPNIVMADHTIVVLQGCDFWDPEG